MNKLGINILKTKDGAGQTLFILNDNGRWENKCVDLRAAFPYLSGMDNKHVVTMLSFEEEGCFVTLVRLIGGKFGENVSAWIYVPNKVLISGQELVSIIDKTKSIILEPSLLEEDLNKIFDIEYDVQYNVPLNRSLKNEGWAVRYVGADNYTLKELLDKDRFQTYYSPFKGIFLLSKDSSVKIRENSKVCDLTNEVLEHICILLPPQIAEIEDVFGHYHVQLQCNGRIFQSSVFVKKGNSVQITAIREGFENIEYSFVVDKEEQKCSFPNKSVVWERKISSNMFYIELDGEDGCSKSATISINNKVINNRDQYLTEEQCKDALVTVSLDGYNKYEKKHNLLGNTFYIKLEKEIRCFKSDIKLANGGYGSIEIKSKNLRNSKKCPIKGYVFEEEDTLVYDNSRDRKLFFRGVVSTIIVGLLAYIGYDWYDSHTFDWGIQWPPLKVREKVSQSNNNNTYEWEKDTNTPEKVNQTNEIETNEQKKIDYSRAIQYLETNDPWKKNEMEKIPGLVGVYDVVNHCRIDSLNQYLSNLKESSRIVEIVNLIKENRSNIQNKEYSKDGTITFEKYVNRLKENKKVPTRKVSEDIKSNSDDQQNF